MKIKKFEELNESNELILEERGTDDIKSMTIMEGEYYNDETEYDSAYLKIETKKGKTYSVKIRDMNADY